MPPSDIWIYGLLGSLLITALHLLLLLPLIGYVTANKLGASRRDGIGGAYCGFLALYVLAGMIPIDFSPNNFWELLFFLVCMALYHSTSGLVGALVAIGMQRRSGRADVV